MAPTIACVWNGAPRTPTPNLPPPSPYTIVPPAVSVFTHTHTMPRDARPGGNRNPGRGCVCGEGEQTCLYCIAVWHAAPASPVRARFGQLVGIQGGRRSDTPVPPSAYPCQWIPRPTPPAARSEPTQQQLQLNCSQCSRRSTVCAVRYGVQSPGSRLSPPPSRATPRPHAWSPPRARHHAPGGTIGMVDCDGKGWVPRTVPVTSPLLPSALCPLPSLPSLPSPLPSALCPRSARSAFSALSAFGVSGG